MTKFSEVRRILIVILLLNWFVAFSKVIYGLITKSAAMAADGVHSFGAGASNIIGLIGIWAASKPKDEGHPYGHKKFETFATQGIAGILFLAALDILREASLRIFHPVVPDVTVFSFFIMALTMGINLAVMKYEHRKGLNLSSDILVCDALHTKSDLLASVAVVASLVSIKIGYPFLDTIVAGTIAVLVAKTGIEILKASSNVLCDANALAKSKIVNIVKEISGVESVHNIRTRGRGDDIHVDLHVIIDAKMNVEAAHNLSHTIETTLKHKILGVTDVLVHLEPAKNKQEKLRK